jgi:hypothetical protein
VDKGASPIVRKIGHHFIADSYYVYFQHTSGVHKLMGNSDITFTGLSFCMFAYTRYDVPWFKE